MTQQTPTQELVAEDVHGYQWKFKHIFRGDESISSELRSDQTSKSKWIDNFLISSTSLRVLILFYPKQANHGDIFWRQGGAPLLHQRDWLLGTPLYSWGTLHNFVSFDCPLVDFELKFSKLYYICPEGRTESCGLESDVLIVNRTVCLHLSYRVIACILECLLLHAMLLKPELCSPYTINQGIHLLLLYGNIYDKFLRHYAYLFSLGLSRTSQFIISLNKYLQAMNNKFTVGARFKMRFEGDDSPERR